ncbi:MAG: hypothetical protein H7321_08720 [Bacteroidia bacterium]|nr:hypothetical protein [Bacteroidia bacterium]
MQKYIFIMMRFCLIVSCIFLSGNLGAQKLLKAEILDKIDPVSYPARNPSPVIKLSILGKEFSSLKKLEEYKSIQVLRIENCSFKDLIIDLNKFPVLQDIYISDCKFERFEIIGNPVNLIKICIYENHFDNFNFLSSLTSLKEFYTSDTISLEIESLTENLLKLSNINSIGIYDGNIKYLPKAFGHFKELDYLVLGSIKKNVDLFSMFNVLTKINIKSLSLTGGDFDSLPSNTGELNRW